MSRSRVNMNRSYDMPTESTRLETAVTSPPALKPGIYQSVKMNTRAFICGYWFLHRNEVLRSTAFRRSTTPNYRFGLICRFGSNRRWEKRCGILAQPIVVSTGVVARGRRDNPTIVASGYKVQKTVEARLIVKDGAPNAPNTASPSIINGNTGSASYRSNFRARVRAR